MLASRSSSAASSHRRYESNFVSSDDLYEADSFIGERSQIHANRAMKDELGDVTQRPPLAGFSLSEKVLPIPPLRRHPTTLRRTAAASVPSTSPPSETISIIAISASASAPAVTVPRIGTSPAPRALVPFHKEYSLWPYPRASLDHFGDMVELGFADTSALSNVDAFEGRARTAKTVQNCRRMIEGESGRMCLRCYSQRRRGVVACGFWETVSTGSGPCHLVCEWASSLILAFAPIGWCQGQSTRSSIRASEKSSTGGLARAPPGYNNSKAPSLQLRLWFRNNGVPVSGSPGDISSLWPYPR